MTISDECIKTFEGKLGSDETLLLVRPTIPAIRWPFIGFCVCIVSSLVIVALWIAYPSAADICTGYQNARCRSLYSLVIPLPVLFAWVMGVRSAESWLSRRDKVHVCVALTNRRILRSSDFLWQSYKSLDYLALTPRLAKKHGVIHSRRQAIAMGEDDAALVFGMITKRQFQ